MTCEKCEMNRMDGRNTQTVKFSIGLAFDLCTSCWRVCDEFLNAQVIDMENQIKNNLKNFILGEKK